MLNQNRCKLEFSVTPVSVRSTIYRATYCGVKLKSVSTYPFFISFFLSIGLVKLLYITIINFICIKSNKTFRMMGQLGRFHSNTYFSIGYNFLILLLTFSKGFRCHSLQNKALFNFLHILLVISSLEKIKIIKIDNTWLASYCIII